MAGHLGVESPDLPACLTQAQAELGLFSGDHALAEAVHGHERVDPGEEVASAGEGLADGRIPLDVAEQVVDALLRVPLATPSRRDRRLRRLVERGGGPIEPRGVELAVPVDELDVGGRGALGSGGEARPALRARAAVKGTEVSRSTSSAPSSIARSRLPSVEPEST